MDIVSWNIMDIMTLGNIRYDVIINGVIFKWNFLIIKTVALFLT